ncbi:5'/3'-nucleotidase SurE [uncultured Desulfovibrio sp.]|uniref:5'/3'-nucleotidase SurE n=1 Tax=uncultured Desulfovibrio sp. TaxID=167968 RepID=UPI00262DC996|nr:5'/3'-nucleotidase SurE [uncultured Desulfovibrio sp.]
MDVLLTNDDGIRAPGLRALYAALREAGHTVHVVAPMRQQSGVGHSLTVFDPLRAMEISEADFSGIGLYGTPTDCVKLALGNLLKKRPDLVMSGINAGPNVGPDILYSGTVGAATEAAHEALPTMAVSCDVASDKDDLLPQARHAVALAQRIQWKRLAPRRVINVNYPRGPLEKSKGLRICPQTSAVWKNAYLERKDPRGAPYWWLVGEIPPQTINAGSDKDLLNRGYVTVTPLRFEFTDYAGMAELELMDLEERQAL